MIGLWFSRLVHGIRQRQDRALRHAYAPRLEAWREIAALPDPTPKPTQKAPLNLQVYRAHRKTEAA